MRELSKALKTDHNKVVSTYRTVSLAPDANLRCGRVHEVIGAGADIFCLSVAARHRRDTIWIGLNRDIKTICPSGIFDQVSPERLLCVEGISRGELLWAAEQALRSEGAFCVVLDMPDRLSLRESRRLQLAAEQGGGIGLVQVKGEPMTSAAQTRWACYPVSDTGPAWDWRCIKGKNGEAGRWLARYAGGPHAEDTLHLAATAAA